MRALPKALNHALSTGARRPAYRVYVWVDSDYTAVITGTYTEVPFDLTPYVTDLKVTHEQLSINFTDQGADLHPDYGTYRGVLANGVIVRLKEGDARVDESAWMWTFTGKVKGQYGYAYSRAEKAFKGQVSVYYRGAEQALKRRKISTQEYSVGTDLGITLGDILGMLGITEEERRVSAVLGRNYHHKTNQIVQLSPWESIESLLYPAFQVPFFDGEGKLAAYTKDVARTPDLTLPDYVKVHKIEATLQTGEPTNKVVVKYLDSDLSQIEGEDQKLGEASITTGFFTSKETIKCYWSDDKKQRAKNTRLKIIKSVNANLLPVGTESYQENDEYSGTITINISVWVPTLAGAMLAAYLAAAYKPDKTESTATNKTPTVITVPGAGTTLTSPPGGGPVTGVIMLQPASVTTTEDQGFTIPWGRVVQATALTGILAIMMSLGSAQYEVWGTPYDLVYLEKEHIAIEEGISYWEENEVEIENDFIGTSEVAESLAVGELHYLRSSFYVRRITMDDLPGLEPGDIIQLPYEGRYFVTGFAKSIKPGTLPVLEVDCFQVMQMEIED